MADEDEFDSIFDDDLLDPELEQSLAQVEASYTASQSVQAARPASKSTRLPGSHLGNAIEEPSSAFRYSAANPGNRKGAFINPAKRQKLGNGLARVTSGGHTGLRHEAVIVEDDAETGEGGRDAGVAPEASAAAPQRNGHSRSVPGRAIRRSPRADEVIVHNLKNDEFGDGDDEWWLGNQGLDQAEEAAIRMSQQPVSQQPAPILKANRSAPQRTAALAERPAGANADLEQLQRQLEELQRSVEQQEATIRQLKSEKQAKEGEVSVVRQNLSKMDLENTKLREREAKMEREHKAALDKLHADNQRQMEQLETATAFRRVEQDTSRRAWPSSVRRLPPSTLRDRDRRQESQAAAGLTTPTKRNRNGGWPGTPGSSRSPHANGGRTAFFTDRAEPVSPSRKASTTNGSTLLPNTRSSAVKAKGKAFSKFQNSFHDVDVLPPKFQPTAAARRGTDPDQGRPTRPTTDTEMDLDQDEGGIDITMDDADGALDNRPSPSRLPQTLSKGNPREESMMELDVTVYRRRQMYFWAVGELIRRRAELVGEVLSHTCQPPSTPLSHPRTKYNPKGSSSQERPNPSRPYATTIHRLMNAEIPNGVPAILLQRYARTTQYLHAVLTQGIASDGEERFYFLLEHDDGWEEALQEGMRDLLEGIAVVLQTLTGLFVRLCMMDCLRDALKLATSLCVAHPALAEQLISPLEWLWSYRLEESLSQSQLEEGDADADRAAKVDLDTSCSIILNLVEAVKKCNVVPISVSSPASVLVEPLHTNVASTDAGHPATAQAQTLVRRYPNRDRARATTSDGAAVVPEEAWDMGSDAREELVEAVIDMLEVFCWAFKDQELEEALRFIGEVDGFLFTLLDRRRKGASIQRTVRLMASMTSNSRFVLACLAARPDPQLGHALSAPGAASTGTTRSSKFPVLEVLSKHLVDRRYDLVGVEWHTLHRTILILLTQVAIQSRDTHTILANSAPLLAALVKCLSLDSDTLWNEGAQGILSTMRSDSAQLSTVVRPGREVLDVGLENLVERLTMDVRLLSVLYRYPRPPPSNGERSDGQYDYDAAASDGNDGMAASRIGLIDLAQRLKDQEAYNMLNGIQQSFIVAMNRIAFAPEPDWMEEEKAMWISYADVVSASEQSAGEAEKARVEERIQGLQRVSARLEAVADLAGDLVDLVLSPVEIDGIYELLADEEEEEEHEGMGVHGLGVGGATAHRDAAHTTGNDQDEDEDEAAIVAEAHPIFDDNDTDLPGNGSAVRPPPRGEMPNRDLHRTTRSRVQSNGDGSETEVEPDALSPNLAAPPAANTRTGAAKARLSKAAPAPHRAKEVVEIHDTDSEPG